HLRARGDLPKDEHPPRRGAAFARHARKRVDRKVRVEHRVADAVAYLVRVPLRDRFGRKQPTAFHTCIPPVQKIRASSDEARNTRSSFSIAAAGIGTLSAGDRLPGVIGPFPQPLWIRQYSIASILPRPRRGCQALRGGRAAPKRGAAPSGGWTARRDQGW